jgi:hypothetical protein
MILVTCDTVASRKVVFVVVILRVEQLLRLGHCRIELDPIATYSVRLDIPNSELLGRFYVRAELGKISQTNTWNGDRRETHKSIWNIVSRNDRKYFRNITMFLKQNKVKFQYGNSRKPGLT